MKKVVAIMMIISVVGVTGFMVINGINQKHEKELEATIQDYEAQIKSLKEANSKLSNENSELSDKISNVSNEVYKMQNGEAYKINSS